MPYLLSAPSFRGASKRLAVATACAAAAAAAVVVLRENPNAAVALHAADRLTNERFGSMAAWLGVNAFVLAIGASWVIVPGAVLGLKSLVRDGGAGRVFAVLALLLTAGCLFEAASWSAHDQGTYERFVIYLVPLLAIAFVAWVESGRGSSRSPTHRFAYGMALAAVLVPLTSRLHVESDNSPTLTGLAVLGPASGVVVWAPLLAALAAALALVGPRKRNAVAVSAVVVAAVIAASTAYAYVDFASHRPAPRVSTGHDAAFVTWSEDDPVYTMRALFWNPRIERVLVVGEGECTR